jgi:hypothetical protein
MSGTVRMITMAKTTTYPIRPLVDGCIHCGLTIKALLTWAHDNDDPAQQRLFRLCWNCHHGLYDNSLITTAELVACQEAWDRGDRRRARNQLYKRIEAEIGAGLRVRENIPAKRAVATMQAKSRKR